MNQYTRKASIATVMLMVSCDVLALDEYSPAIEEELSVVFTPSRLEQHRKNVPAAVTVITSKKLKSLGISSLPEAMRLVPGMRVNQASGWDYRVSFHGTNSLVPRRMLVMIDGMSVYRYGLAQVDWNRLAIDVEDIQRIEVTRSPSAASYGSNAFQAVVNIITKHPQDVDSLSLLAEAGTENTERLYARGSTTVGNTAILASVSKHSDDGFDSVSFDRYKDPVPGAIDSQDVERFLIRSETNLSEKDTLELRAGGVRADLEEEEVDPDQVSPPDKSQEDWHVQAKYGHIFSTSHHATVQTYIRQNDYNESWRSCRPALLFLPELRNLAQVNRDLALGLTSGNIQPGETVEENQLLQAALARVDELGAGAFQPLCATANHDLKEQSVAVEAESTYQPFGNTRINTGVGHKDNKVESETLAGGTVGTEHTYIFSNAEVVLSDTTVINAGFIYEDASNLEDPVFNPRIGLNYHLHPEHTVRLAYSSASRLPNILETDRDWNYYSRDWDRTFDGRTEGFFFLDAKSSGTLEPEKVESVELGFYGSNVGYTYDVRIYREELRSLISEKPAFHDFSLSNNSEVTLEGLEAEVTFRVSPSLEVSGGYSYIDNDHTNFYEQSAHSDHAGFANVSYYTNQGALSLAYYGNSRIAGEAYDRWDVTYLNSFMVRGNSSVGIRLTAQYLPSLDHAYQVQADNRAILSFDDEWHYRAEISFSL